MLNTLKNKNEIKIFILYLLKHIGYPLAYADINDVVVQDDVVNYFDFVDCFAELVETKNIIEITDEEGKKKYTVSNQGALVVDTLDNNIISTIRDGSLKNALRLLALKQRKVDFKCDYTVNEDGKCDFFCFVSENGIQTMKINLIIDNAFKAEKMKKNFYTKPDIIANGVMALFSGDVDYLLK